MWITGNFKIKNLVISNCILILGAIIKFFKVRKVVIVHMFKICVATSIEMHEITSAIVTFMHRI